MTTSAVGQQPLHPHRRQQPDAPRCQHEQQRSARRSASASHYAILDNVILRAEYQFIAFNKLLGQQATLNVVKAASA